MPGAEEGGSLAFLPGVDRILRRAEVEACVLEHGHDLVVESVRGALDEFRAAARRGGGGAGGGADPASRSGRESGPGTRAAPDAEDIERLVAEAALRRARAAVAPSLRPVLNLSGTVLHTNLGRAELPEVAVEAMAEAARSAMNLEIDLATGRRGERDTHVEGWLARLTGAEAATVVNNNAAAVLLVLNTLALAVRSPFHGESSSRSAAPSGSRRSWAGPGADSSRSGPPTGPTSRTSRGRSASGPGR